MTFPKPELLTPVSIDVSLKVSKQLRMPGDWLQVLLHACMWKRRFDAAVKQDRDINLTHSFVLFKQNSVSGNGGKDR